MGICKTNGLNCPLENYKTTVEFRMPNTSMNKTIWQNNINFFTHFINYFNTSQFDPEFINYTYNNLETKHGEYVFIDSTKALELANLIYQKDNDKLDFLTQYIKQGDESGIYKTVKKLTI